MHPQRLRVGRPVFAALAMVATICALAACTPTAPTPTPTVSATGTPGASASPAPELNLNGTAADNRPYFDKVNTALIAAGGTLNGRAFIDNLVAVGYTKAAMQVTADRTAANNAADNIEFSVKINGTCLLGQWGNIGYASSVAKPLADGRCLVGATRPIDW